MYIVYIKQYYQVVSGPIVLTYTKHFFFHNHDMFNKKHNKIFNRILREYKPWFLMELNLFHLLEIKCVKTLLYLSQYPI